MEEEIERSGICLICGINLYGSQITKMGDYTIIGYPEVMPCGISGPEVKSGMKIQKATGGTRENARYQCPFETIEQQREINPDLKFLTKSLTR